MISLCTQTEYLAALKSFTFLMAVTWQWQVTKRLTGKMAKLFIVWKVTCVGYCILKQHEKAVFPGNIQEYYTKLMLLHGIRVRDCGINSMYTNKF